MIRPLLALIAALMLLAAPLTAQASGLDLTAAKQQGLVGERIDGLLGAVTPSAEVEALVASVNAGRMKSYGEIAAKRGIPASEVAKVAAQSLIAQTPSGQYVQDVGGAWVKKP